MTMLTTQAVDAVLDTVGEDESPADALVSMLDENEAWDWIADPSTEEGKGLGGVKTAVVESSGAYWAVIARHSTKQAHRCETSSEAHGYVDAFCGA